MSFLDSMNWVSGYIINNLENSNNSNNIAFKIKPVKDPFNNSLCYIFEATENYEKNILHFEIACNSKEEFYEAANTLLIEYFRNSDSLAFTSIKTNGVYDSGLYLYSKNRSSSVCLSIEDEIDALMFLEYKKYLDENIRNRAMNDNDEDLVVKKENVSSLKKIPVRINEKIML